MKINKSVVTISFSQEELEHCDKVVNCLTEILENLPYDHIVETDLEHYEYDEINEAIEMLRDIFEDKSVIITEKK